MTEEGKEKALGAPAAGKLQHTPGPWYHVYDKEDSHWHVEAIDGRTDYPWRIAEAACYTRPDQTGEANAKLMAAAPALADALELVRAWWRTEGYEENFPIDDIDSALRAAGREANEVSARKRPQKGRQR